VAKRLLLVTHHPLEAGGGASARWRSFVRHLPATGWELDISYDPMRLAIGAYAERKEDRRRVDRRAWVLSRIARLTTPPFTLLGMHRSAMPLLTPSIVARGAPRVRRGLERGPYDAVVATGPPMTALLVARQAVRTSSVPLVVDLRDLWAGNPRYDRGGRLLTALEKWVFRRAAAIVATTPEAIDDLRRRYPEFADRLVEIPNGFEPELLDRRSVTARRDGRPITIHHSGTIAPTQPLEPLLRVLSRDRYRGAFRLVRHGYTPPEMVDGILAFADRLDIELVPPSSWEDAVRRTAEADVGLFTYVAEGGDTTSAAGKTYEYLALGKPVLSLTQGGATERLLTRLGANEYCARIEDESSIAAALDRLLQEPMPDPLPSARLAPYSRQTLAARMAELLDRVSGG
jgi:glycosyltransferase involved in cell wall biosynthesis